MKHSNLKDVSVMSVTQFSGSPSKAMREAVRQPIMVVSHHRPVAYVLSVAQWTTIIEVFRQLEPAENWDEGQMGPASREVPDPVGSPDPHP